MQKRKRKISTIALFAATMTCSSLYSATAAETADPSVDVPLGVLDNSALENCITNDAADPEQYLYSTANPPSHIKCGDETRGWRHIVESRQLAPSRYDAALKCFVRIMSQGHNAGPGTSAGTHVVTVAFPLGNGNASAVLYDGTNEVKTFYTTGGTYGDRFESCAP